MPRRPIPHVLSSLILMLSLLSLGSSPLLAAEHFVQVGPGFTFSPTDLTIQVGDTVTWTNAGGFHNVEARDGSFRCANGCDDTGGDGSASADAWSFSRQFNQAGTIDYFCVVHDGAGMRGTLIVEEGTPQEPGNLRFALASVQANEGAGNANIVVNRVNGSDGAVSVSFATANGTAQSGSDYTAANGTLNWNDGDNGARNITVPLNDDGAVEGNETVVITLSNPTGGAGLGTPSTTTLTIVDNDDNTPSPGNLTFAAADFPASEGAGSVTITVNRNGGTDGAVSVDVATSDGSAVEGDDYLATQQTLQWADGDGSSQSFNVDLLDDADEEATETVNLALSNPTGGAGLGNLSSATLSIQDNDTTAELCVPSDQVLCLGENGRFRVEAVFSDFQGNDGVARSFDITPRDSGLLYFFGEDNIEFLVKIINACNEPSFETYWVFYAATTNLEFTLTVTDTVANVSKQYRNDLGVDAPPILDTAAFSTCP